MVLISAWVVVCTSAVAVRASAVTALQYRVCSLTPPYPTGGAGACVGGGVRQCSGSVVQHRVRGAAAEAA